MEGHWGQGESGTPLVPVGPGQTPTGDSVLLQSVPGHSGITSWLVFPWGLLESGPARAVVTGAGAPLMACEAPQRLLVLQGEAGG